jgi:hypothetical protein
MVADDSCEPHQMRVQRSRQRKWDRISRKGMDTFIKNRPDDFMHRVYKGIPPEHRWAVWNSQLLAANSAVYSRESLERDKALFTGKRASVTLQAMMSRGIANKRSADRRIVQDASSICGDLPGFTEEHRQSLCKVLNAFVFIAPEVGYNKGMDYVAAVLLLASNCSEHETLRFMLRLMKDCGFGSCYKQEKMLEEYTKVFDTLLEKLLPDLKKHFDATGIETWEYLHDWLKSLFTWCLPLPTALMMWDIVMCKGFPYLVLVALAFLSSVKDVLLAFNAEDIIDFFEDSARSNSEDEAQSQKVGIVLSNEIQRMLGLECVQSALEAIAPETAAQSTAAAKTTPAAKSTAAAKRAGRRKRSLVNFTPPLETVPENCEIGTPGVTPRTSIASSLSDGFASVNASLAEGRRRTVHFSDDLEGNKLSDQEKFLSLTAELAEELRARAESERTESIDAKENIDADQCSSTIPDKEESSNSISQLFSYLM